MVYDAVREVAIANGKIKFSEAVERYPTAAFLDDVPINVDNRPTIAQVLNDMR
jgi:hypothetical protein